MSKNNQFHLDNSINNLTEYLENIIALLPGHVYWKDPNGVLLGCNELQAISAGLKNRKEIIGKTDYDLPWKAQADQIRKNDIEVMQTGIPKTIEEVATLADGSEAIFLSQKSPLYFKDEIIGVIGVSFDITDRKRSENNLKILQDQTQMALENIIDNIPAHIFWKDRNCILLGCNDLQAKTMGFQSKMEMVGKNNYEVIWSDQLESARRAQADEITRIDMQVMDTGETYVKEEPLVLPDGQTAIFLSRKAPLRDINGNIVGLLGISFDVTEQKRIEQELHETRHKLEGMTLVSASIAHELRTPLAALDIGINSLKNYLPKLFDAYKLAQNAKLPVQQIRKIHMQLLEEALTSMGVETKAAFTFIEMLLMNINPSLEQVDAKPFSVVFCVQETLGRYPFSGSQKALIHFDCSRDFIVLGKELLLVHILFNLLKNALYYIAKAGKGEIYIWQEVDQTSNKIYFKDTGTGINKNDLAHIFDRFFSKTHHGAGIGLTFCKMAMESMGGKISCDSEEGNFTLFILSFPAPPLSHES